MKHTINHMDETSEEKKSLKELWSEVELERQAPELSEVRKLEAYLGYDPDEGPEKLVANLMEARKRYGAEAVNEMAAESRDHAPQRLQDLNKDLQSSDNVVRILDFKAITAQLQTQSGQLIPPWRRAALAAKIAREVWKLPSGPIGTNKICELFEVSANLLTQSNWNQPSQPRELSAGFKEDETQERFRIVLHQPGETSRRFTLARLIGDYLTAQGDHILPATSASTSRQKFQRAFAQEFLCPFNDLMEFLDTNTPGEDDIEEASAYFNVSPLIITRTLENKGILEPEILAEIES